MSVANLEGGVRKTTIAEHLEASPANAVHDVFLVDLDHQHSLSHLCFSEQQRGDLKKSGRVIGRLFLSGAGSSHIICVERLRLSYNPRLREGLPHGILKK